MILYVVNLCPTISLNSEVLNNICSRQILELGFVKDKYLLFVGNQSAFHLGENSTLHSRSKHIDVRYH